MRRVGKVRPLLALLLTAIALVIVIRVGLMRAGGQNVPQTPAELWLSWSADAREEYVWGYLSGFVEGKRVGCSFYADKITPYTPRTPVPPEHLPRQACLDALPDFSKPSKEYVDAMTNYYSRYPHDRQAGMPRILLELASPPGLTIDQIHEKLTR